MQKVTGHYCMELGHYTFCYGSLILWYVSVWLHKGEHGDEAILTPQSHKKVFMSHSVELDHTCWLQCPQIVADMMHKFKTQHLEQASWEYIYLF